ncbi:hypothetical protein F5X99DRAFT_407843 [Biscogniauxia marginata]|nr:hypothetical protein F5X99DRAFT_407843 [Biscogniauxia marginata]
MEDNRSRITGLVDDSVISNIDLLARVLHYWGQNSNLDLDLVLGVVRDNRIPYRHKTLTEPSSITVWIHYGGKHHRFSGLKRNLAPLSHSPVPENVIGNVLPSPQANDLLPKDIGTSESNKERQHTAFENSKGSPFNRNSSLRIEGTDYEREIQRDSRRFGSNNYSSEGAHILPSKATGTGGAQRSDVGIVGDSTEFAPSEFDEPKTPLLAAPKSHIQQSWWRTSASGVGNDDLKDLTSHAAPAPNQNAIPPPSHARQEAPDASPNIPQNNLSQTPLQNNNHNSSAPQGELPETLRKANELQEADTFNWHPAATTSIVPVELGECDFGLLRRHAHQSKIVVEAQNERGLSWYPVDDAIYPSDEVCASRFVAELRAMGLNIDAFNAVLRENCTRLSPRQNQQEQQQRQVVKDAQHRFLCALLRRYCYISAFAEHYHYCHQRGYDEEEQQQQHLVISRSGIYPLLGPDPDLDHFVLDRGLLPRILSAADPGQQGGRFDPNTHPLVRMYGFGARELAWLRRNTDEAEREAQWDTILRFHALQAWIGPASCADVKETLEFAFYRIRDSRKAAAELAQNANANTNMVGTNPNLNPGAAAARLRKLRRLEFDVAALLVDRLWRDARANRGRRTIPFIVRKQQRRTPPPPPAPPHPSHHPSSYSTLPPPPRWSRSSNSNGNGNGYGYGNGNSGSSTGSGGDWDRLPARTQWELLGLPGTSELARKYADLMKEPFPFPFPFPLPGSGRV